MISRINATFVFEFAFSCGQWILLLSPGLFCSGNRSTACFSKLRGIRGQYQNSNLLREAKKKEQQRPDPVSSRDPVFFYFIKTEKKGAWKE